MPRGFDDAVRSYQLPTSAPGQAFVPGGLTPNLPIYITAGFGSYLTAGGIGQGLSPAVIIGTAHYDVTVTYYMEQAANEAKEKVGGF